MADTLRPSWMRRIASPNMSAVDNIFRFGNAARLASGIGMVSVTTSSAKLASPSVFEALPLNTAWVTPTLTSLAPCSRNTRVASAMLPPVAISSS